jgi:hypothetical protein
MIKARRIRQAWHVARMGQERNEYGVFVAKPEGKRPLGIPRRRWEENIKIHLTEIGRGGTDWFHLAGSCELGNEPSLCSIKCRGVLE